jgi:hypothetical protein
MVEDHGRFAGYLATKNSRHPTGARNIAMREPHID